MIPLLNKIILLITKVHKGSFKSLGLLILIVLNTFIEALGIVVILFFLKILINEKILNDYLQAINNYLSSHQYFILNEYSTKKEFIIILIFFIILIYTLRFLFSLFYIIKLSNYNSYLEEIFSNKLYKNFINKDYEHIFYINSNDFLRNLIANTNALTAVINFYFYLLSEIIIFIILLILLFYLQSFYLSVIFIFIFSSMSLIIYFRNKEIKKIGEIYNSSMSNKVRIITETFQGIREIIIYKYNNYLYDYFTLINKNKSDPTKKLFIANSIIRPLIEYFFILFILITAILAFYINKKDIIDISSLIAFFLISIRLLPCISRILTNIQNINYRRAAVNSIIDELNISFNISNILKKKESKLFFEFKKKIEFKSISFSYKNDKTLVLNDASFFIKKNSKVFLSGKSGSGKSTILDIIAGLLKINTGEIYIDDNIIKKNEYNLKNKISYVTQKFFLINKSIKENICLGIKNELVNIELLNKVIEISELKNLSILADKQIGENGSQLSGGQRQKIAIARAIYNKPDILILDEATNSLDSYSEFRILENIIRECKDITIIVTSHKNIPNIKFDNTLILQDGKIKESKE